MKKLVLSFLLLSLLSGALLAQKTVNDANAEKRTVSSFHGIEVSTGIKLLLTSGSTEEVAVSASEIEYRDKIVTSVENGILKIHYETKLGAINKKNQNKDLRAYVSYKTLNYLNANTGAEVEIKNKLVASVFELKANTGGEVKGEVNIGTLMVTQSTGSRITLSGETDKLEVEGGTGSKFMGDDMNTKTCDVNVGTGAGVYLMIEKEMNVKASTGGYVKYKGAGGIRDIKTNTGGIVSRI
ncbi:MAG: head GIN domain-containing protein [Chitinophagaceae bacterium]